jgi:hypothetical protein
VFAVRGHLYSQPDLKNEKLARENSFQKPESKTTHISRTFPGHCGPNDRKQPGNVPERFPRNPKPTSQKRCLFFQSYPLLYIVHPYITLITLLKKPPKGPEIYIYIYNQTSSPSSENGVVRSGTKWSLDWSAGVGASRFVHVILSQRQCYIIFLCLFQF